MKNTQTAETHPLGVGYQGFTLVELAVALAIMGLLVVIAIPQYQRYLDRGRQSEAKMALGAAYVAEQNFFVLNATYTGCLGDIGVAGQGPIQYYAVGLLTSSGTNLSTCGPRGTLSCLAFVWNIPFNVVATSCTAGPFTNGSTLSYEPIYANVSANPSSLPIGTVNTDLYNAGPATISNVMFKIEAFGSISSSSTFMDEWSIDQNKTLTNIQLGI